MDGEARYRVVRASLRDWIRRRALLRVACPWWGLDGTFIESLKKTHFGDGIFLAASERATVSFAQASSADCSTKILKGNAERRSAEIT